MNETSSLVEQIKEHAYQNYNGNQGWDFVIETMEDADIEDALLGRNEWDYIGDPVTTIEEAIERFLSFTSLWAEQVLNTSFGRDNGN